MFSTLFCKIARRVAFVLSIIFFCLLLYNLTMPFSTRISSPVLAVYTLLLLAAAVMPGLKQYAEKKAIRLLHGLSVIGAVTASLIFIISAAFIIFGADRIASRDIKERQDKTVIVLGCQIVGRAPGASLKNRLDTAAYLLTQNQTLNCVVSGGRGKDELYPEAQVMKEYLVAKGIDPQRIIEEGESETTLQNLKKSYDIIIEENLPRNIIIVTDFYHAFRAQKYAKTLGLTSQSYSCVGNIRYLPSMWLRESVGITLMLLGLGR